MDRYDNWKLDTPPHYENSIEIFESDLDKYYHSNESILIDFENKVAELAKELGLYDSEEVANEKSK